MTATGDRTQPATAIDSEVLPRVVNLFERFLNLEQPLFEREALGVRYWHYIRFTVINQIFAQLGWVSIVDQRREKSLLEKVRVLQELVRYSLLNSIRHDKRACELLVVNTANKVRRNDSYFDQFTDTWLAEVETAHTVWEMPSLWRHKGPPRDEKTFYLDGLLLRATLASHFRRMAASELRREIKTVLHFAGQLGVQLEEEAIARIVSYVVCLHRCCAPRVLKKLKHKHPRVLVIVNHYDPLHMLIVAQARALGIYVIELQHGNMGRYHVAYNLKYDGRLPTLPDEIFTFGPFWNDTARLQNHDVKLTAIGWPYFENRYMGGKPKERLSKRKQTRILFLSQETIGRQMAKVAHALADKLERSRYEVVFKCHPREYRDWQARYGRFLSRPEIRVATDEDLHTLLATSDVHVGVYSTTIMESLAYNKQLILLDFYGIHVFADFVARGRADLARNAEDIVALLQKRPTTYDRQLLDYFWTSDSRHNLLNRLSEVLASRRSYSGGG